MWTHCLFCLSTIVIITKFLNCNQLNVCSSLAHAQFCWLLLTPLNMTNKLTEWKDTSLDDQAAVWNMTNMELKQLKHVGVTGFTLNFTSSSWRWPDFISVESNVDKQVKRKSYPFRRADLCCWVSSIFLKWVNVLPLCLCWPETACFRCTSSMSARTPRQHETGRNLPRFIGCFRPRFLTSRTKSNLHEDWTTPFTTIAIKCKTKLQLYTLIFNW